jgi:tetratricopeptide (TPR) repeat protein
MPRRKREERAAELTWHFLEGDDPERALPYAVLAGDAAEVVFAHAEAEEHYRTAAHLARELADRAKEARALEKLGSALAMQSRADESLQALEAAERLYRELNDDESLTRVVAGIGSALMHLGRTDAAIARLHVVLDTMQDSAPSTGLAGLSLQLSAILYGAGRYDEAVHVAQRASEVAQAVGDTITRASAENYRADLLMQMGRFRAGFTAFEANIPISEDTGDLGILAHTLNDLAVTLIFLGRFQEAETYARRTVELQMRRDSPAMVAFALVVLGWAQVHAGRWRDARRTTQESVALIRDLPPSWHAPFILSLQGQVDQQEGRSDEAIRRLEEAIAVGGPDHVIAPFAQRFLAEEELLAGKAAAARARLEPYRAGGGIYVQMMLPTLVCAYLEDGNVTMADVLARELVEDTLREFPLALADALRALSMVRARQGRIDAAAQTFAAAIDLAGVMPYPFAIARALYEWGLMDQQAGQDERARERLIEALTIFRDLGAVRYAALADVAVGQTHP